VFDVEEGELRQLWQRRAAYEGVPGGHEERTHLVQGVGDGCSAIEAVEREVAVTPGRRTRHPCVDHSLAEEQGNFVPSMRTSHHRHQRDKRMEHLHLTLLAGTVSYRQSCPSLLTAVLLVATTANCSSRRPRAGLRHSPSRWQWHPHPLMSLSGGVH
jgi:hypothetical protein